MTGARIAAVIITATAHTLSTVIDAEGRLLTATGVVRWVAGHTGRVDTLLAITIGVGSTGDARATVGGTEGRFSGATGVIRRVTGHAGFVDTLAGPWVATIEVTLAAYATQYAVVVITDGRVTAAALV